MILHNVMRNAQFLYVQIKRNAEIVLSAISIKNRAIYILRKPEYFVYLRQVEETFHENTKIVWRNHK